MDVDGHGTVDLDDWLQGPHFSESLDSAIFDEISLCFPNCTVFFKQPQACSSGTTQPSSSGCGARGVG